MKVVVFISGDGTNLQALIQAGIRIALVVSNNPSAYGIKRAMNSNIPTLVHASKRVSGPPLSREEYDQEVSDRVIGRVGVPELIIFAGYMRIVVRSLLFAMINSQRCF
jgi:phosphoribosylglycinamide formyltransferase 1